MRVIVDPRVELMSIVFRLAGNPEYSQQLVPGYVKEVEKHFGQFGEHEVVGMARRLRRDRGVSYDAVMSFAILNRGRFTGFRGVNGMPLESVPVRFRTRKE